MRWCALVVVCLGVVGCGSDAPTLGPSPVLVAPALASVVSTFIGSVTDTVTGAPVLGFTATRRGSRVTVEAPGYLTRETANGPTVDLIPTAAPFDLAFYRRFVRGGAEGATGEPLRRHRTAPRFYLRTLDDAGQPIDGPTLTMVAAALADLSPYTGGVFSTAVVEQGRETRVGQPGWITVTWNNPVTADNCATSMVGGAWIALNYLETRCRCGGWTTRPHTVRHELGHVMGFHHTNDDADLLSGLPDARCDKTLSARERYHAGLAYHRPAGNRDLDVDPVNAQDLRPGASVVID